MANEWDLNVLAAMKKYEDLQKNTSAIDNAQPMSVADTFHLTPGGKAQQGTQADQYALQEKRRIQALQAQKDAVLGSLKQEKAKIDPAYRTGLSNIAGESARQARSFAEYLAQRGQTQSGLAAQGELQRGADLLTQQGILEQQRADAFSDIARRESDVIRDYELGRTDAGYERQIAQLQAQEAIDERNRTESINTIGQYFDDYAREIQAIEAEIARGDNSRAYLLPYLKMARQDKVTGIEQAKADQAQRDWERWLAEQNLAIKQGSLDLDWQKYRNPVTRGGSGGGSRGGSGGGGGGKPTLTAAQARDALNNGVVNQSTVDAYNYYYGTNYTVGEANRMINGREPIRLNPNPKIGGMGGDIIQAQMNGEITPQEGQFLRWYDMLNKFK